MKLSKLHLLNSFLSGLCLLSVFTGYGQGYFNKDPRFLKANSIWTFGDSSGLDFTTGKAVAFKTSMQSMEGNVAVSDPNTGKLLFYSNGGYVMDAAHQKMPNGTGLTGNPIDASQTHLSNFSTTQGVCAVPMIDSPGKYFLFSMRGNTSGVPLPTGSLFYSVVDMSLNNGLGDVVAGRKNIPLDSDTLSESMIAIPGDNCDIWLLIHNMRKAQFKAYRITSAGINTVPVISSTGQSLSGPGAYGTGYLAVSPDRKKIAVTSLSFNTEKDVKGAVIARFNPATGQVTDGIKIINSDFAEYGVTGACFSPDNSKLYLVANEISKVTYDFVAKICQFEVDVYDSATIVNSVFVLADDFASMGGLRLYNDTVYIGGIGATKLGQIGKPDLKGAACEFQKASVNLITGKPFYYDLGNDIVYTLTGSTRTDKVLDTAVCSGLGVELKAKKASVYLWDDGSAGAVRMVSQAGTYWVSGIDGCIISIDTFVVRDADQLSESIQLDTTLCPGFDLKLESINTTAGSYLWNDGSTSSARRVDTGGTYWVRSLDGCHTFVDTFIVGVFSFTPPKIWVDRDTLGTILPYSTYQWLFNDTIIRNATNSIYIVPKNGKYRVVVTNEHGCTDTSEVYEVTNVKVEDVHPLAAQVRVYPNPASDAVYVSAPVEVSLSLHSIEGKVISHPGDSKRLSLQGLTEGMYFLQICDRSGRLIKIEKVTKLQ